MAVRRLGWVAMPSRARLATLVGLVVAGAMLSACGQLQPATTPSTPTVASAATPATQTSEGGMVTVFVTWQGPSAGPVFTVAMDTHAVDLDGYDLAKQAVLRTDQGREARPSAWDAPKGGHHRSGTLAFPTTAADGSPLIGTGTRAIELVIRDVAGVPERTFRWTL